MSAFFSALLNVARRLLVHLLVWAFGLILLFEEWGWDHLAAAIAWLGRQPGLRWLEGRIRRLPPYAALALFAIPVLFLLPLKILALFWLGHGHVGLGLVVIVVAKVGGTALTARLFMLTHDALMTLPWFARLMQRWLAFKNWILDTLRASAAWQHWLQCRRALSQQIRQWWDKLRGGPR